MRTSEHANIRSQQRAIAPMVIDLLLQFGTAQPAGDGASKVFFDKAARRRVKAYAGSLAGLLDEHLDVYAVVGSDNTVVTVAHRIERIQRH
ncbi:hypothetical protein [Aromatoleum bremense]|uniref:Uncharacterized protein n=1 Tax=Aromatoleum bremense TaxID=76115 RepID=A0ABX1NX63_9RHOO|nr:hypothetical protein [Aromatoleum bremense]NMG16383.1 hypothetical protein [Aromatoleum bremense]QTQ31287.1 Uncharacterized protein pbN1_12960 [Aromatoleum bremense]